MRGDFFFFLILATSACRSSTQREASVSSTPSAARERLPVTAATGSVSSPPRSVAGASVSVPEDASLGRFVLRLEIIPSDDDDFECVPFISDLAGLADGEAWVVGSCGLRGRLTETGFVDLAAAWEKKGRTFANQKYSCPAHAAYFAALARSPRDVYAVGDTRCGLDPNSIWFRAPERFDGRAWHSLAHQGARMVPDVLAAAAAGPVYGLTDRSRDEVRTAPSACAITVLSAGQSRVLRQCRAARHSTDGSSGEAEHFVSIGVSVSGALWVSGERVTWNGSAERSARLLLRHEKGLWTEQPFDDMGEIVRAASGELWLIGAAAWQEHEGAWRKVSLQADLHEASDVCVKSPNDIWWLGPNDTWHFDGENTRRVKSESPDDRSSVMRLEMAGPNLYASSQFKVWQLVSPSAPAPKPITLHLGRAPAALR
ncbi:MAG TPA: hypothetical protein VK524_04170 [Polyangiaceae bacterium]|nr:hypothetical protein [Polyangiaceae bacterium]